MRRLFVPALVVALLPAAVTAQTPAATDTGKETSIPFASNGGLINWQSGPPDSGIIYVQDRTLRWYKVTLSGPCGQGAIDPLGLTYTTDPTGTFDQFSQVRIGRFPDQTCGVASIRTSGAPPGQPGAAKGAKPADR
ncbi:MULTISPECIES: hypothetical protein [unclassified Sphingomonas]|jgi:hypothetical protein|uniref:hypothetical protein n=1 Tax=unclassified Sphingomonas TaxID=196159 RepID=UPI000E101559|nr:MULTISPECIES: hypothetical protein [unclassified Sphingomonas]AXJ94545.1 hypothetical protein DM480_02605 [Sphingomonas sp. FARSPH]